MSDIDHAAEAVRILQSLLLAGDGPMSGMYDEDDGNEVQLAAAQVHATLEQAKWLRELVIRLDSMPLLPTIPKPSTQCDVTDDAGNKCWQPRNHDGDTHSYYAMEYRDGQAVAAGHTFTRSAADG